MNTRLSRTSKIKLLLAGGISGAVWSLLPIFFDDGWAIPKSNEGITLTMLSGVVTGITITAIFHILTKKDGKGIRFIFSLVSLPLAIGLFSVLLHISRKILAVEFTPEPAQGDFLLIIESYIFYGFLGAGIALLPLAFVNHTIITLFKKRLCQPGSPYNSGQSLRD